MNLIRRLFPFRTCTIDIQDGERALQRPCLLYHIKRCQGPCIEAISKDAYRADIDQVELFLEGRQETLVKALGREMRPPSERTEYERAADRCATRSGPSSGRWRARRWRPSPRTELDVVGPRAAGQPGRGPAVRDPRRQDDRPRRVPARRRARGPRRRGAGELPRAVLRARDVDPARGLRPDACAEAAASRRSWPSAAAARSTCASRSAARSASSWPWPRGTRPRRWRASRPAGWPTRARRSPRSRSWPTRSGCPGRRCASSATTSATSRAANRSAAWSCSRTAGRAPASTAGSGSGP